MEHSVEVDWVVGDFALAGWQHYGGVRLLVASLGLVVTPIPSLVVSALSLLVVGGRWVGTILLRKHLSQRCRSGWGGGLTGFQ